MSNQKTPQGKKKEEEFVHRDTVKEKFNNFMEALNGMKKSCSSKQTFKTDLRKIVASKEYQHIMPGVDSIVSRNLTPDQKRRSSIPGALQRLKDEELKKLNNMAILSGRHVVSRNGECTPRWQQENKQAHNLELAIMEEFRRRF